MTRGTDGNAEGAEKSEIRKKKKTANYIMDELTIRKMAKGIVLFCFFSLAKKRKEIKPEVL